MNSPYIKVKRALDISFALLLLILLLPVLCLISIVIRIDSPGPAIYRQRRIGRFGKSFTMYKFRTMKIGTPVLSTAEMQARGINTLTRTGNLLRKTSLDELPQLINIIKGEMSFIGPRPALPTQDDVNELRQESGVHKLRPGITGLAQVMGRDDLDVETKVGYDTDYYKRLNFSLDLEIIMRTFQAVLTARGNK